MPHIKRQRMRDMEFVNIKKHKDEGIIFKKCLNINQKWEKSSCANIMKLKHLREVLCETKFSWGNQVNNLD
jgi:hypothetical protein